VVWSLYQFRLHRNDGPLGVVRGSWGNVELLTLTLSFPSNQKRYQLLALRLFTNNPLLRHRTQLLGQFLIANFKLLLQAIDNCITLDSGENFLNYRILSQGAPGAAFF